MTTQLLEEEEAAFIEGVPVQLSDFEVTLETRFGWCTIPLTGEWSKWLSIGTRVHISLDGMSVVSVKRLD